MLELDARIGCFGGGSWSGSLLHIYDRRHKEKLVNNPICMLFLTTNV